MNSCDVLVAGAGPAGSLASLELARAGLRVIVADGSAAAKSPKIGEGLPSVGWRLLRSLGLATSDFGTVHSEIGGNLACWASDELEVTDFLNDPDGPGWRLSRRQFDAWLLDAAVSAGARLVPFHLDAIARSAGGANWEAGTKSGEIIRSKWLVDATGRGSSAARRLGHVRVRDAPGLVALYVFGESRPADSCNRTLVEAVPEGWWYGAVLPQGKAILSLHVRPDDAGRARQDWRNALGRTSYMREFFPASGFPEPPTAAEAGGSRLDALFGANWIACGDAALAFDPLSSQGIYTAMYSGLAAARAIVGSKSGDEAMLGDYGCRLGQIQAVYKARLTSSYRSVRRWPDAPFWASWRS